jgi:dephospho-CoA kinase
MKIFVVVGMPASGKNIARIYAESKGIPYFATGDLVRAEVEKRMLPPTPENTARVSTELRGVDGLGVTRLALAAALASKANVVFLEGMRSLQEVTLISEKTEAVTIAFLAPRKMRLQRIIARGRSDDSPKGFDERDSRELAYGTALPIALADAYVLNTGSLEDAINSLADIVGKG